MKRFLLFLLFLVVGFALFYWIVKVVGWQEIKTAVYSLKSWQGVAIFAVTFLIMLVSAWKWKAVFKSLNVKVGLGELLKIYLAGFAVLFFTPSVILGGDVFRCYTLGKRSPIPFKKRAASIIIDRILEITVQFLIILFGIFFFLYKIGFTSFRMTLFLGGIFLVFVLALSFFYFKLFKKQSLLKSFLKKLLKKKFSENNHVLETEQEVFSFFHPKKKAMWQGFGLAIVRASLMLARAWLLILFLGKALGLFSTLSILGFSYLAVLVPIPTAIGTHEAAQVFAFSSLGMPGSLAPAFTMVIRGTELLIALIGLIILFKIGFWLLKKLLFEKISQFTLGFTNQDNE